MTVLKLLMTATFALVAGWFVELAKADEAYVCEGGRIAYVKLGQLERMKREDPCIASYYGGTVAQSSSQGAVGTPIASAGPDGRSTASTNSPGAVAETPTQTGAPQGLKLINANESGRWFTQRQPVR